MRRLVLLLSAVATCIALSSFPAAAGDKEDCDRLRGVMQHRKLTTKQVIDACTREIKSASSTVYVVIFAYNTRGMMYLYYAKNLDQAFADFGAAIKAMPASPNSEEREEVSFAYSNRGLVQQRRGDLKRALAEYDLAVNVDPTRYWAPYGERAAVRTKLGDIDGAISDLNVELRKRPDYAFNYYHRADAYERKGDIDAARADFQTLLDIIEQKESRKESVTLPDGVDKSKVQQRLAALKAEERAAPSPPVQAAVAALAVPLPAAPVANPGRRVALVIGNSAYTAVAALPNPKRDAQAVASGLRNVGFKIVMVENDATRDRLIAALRAFEDEAEKADWAVIYYAGHGIEMGGVNYLVPVDARLKSDRDVQDEAVPLDRALSAAGGAKKLRLVVLDACRDNPFVAQMRRTVASRSIGRGLASIEPEGGTLVAYAAKHGQTALDGDGANSPFVSAFIKYLTTPNLEITKLFRLVRDDVMDATAGRQEPFTYGSLPGREDFFFVQK